MIGHNTPVVGRFLLHRFIGLTERDFLDGFALAKVIGIVLRIAGTHREGVGGVLRMQVLLAKIDVLQRVGFGLPELRPGSPAESAARIPVLISIIEERRILLVIEMSFITYSPEKWLETPHFFVGVYQIGEDQARSWIVAGTSGDNGSLFLAES